jgi:hypothetical protein
MALLIGVWVLVYMADHNAMDPVSRGLAVGTAVASLGFGGYVIVRRVRRGPQH